MNQCANMPTGGKPSLAYWHISLLAHYSLHLDLF